ncbi:MAG TPA: response regulator transcription factor [Bryobacteraceae bacterium]|nr:response regulator transcription factor [Bryobacteraceae bacterium]
MNTPEPPKVSGASAAKPRILLADDHSLVVAGLSKLLEKDFEIAGVASNGRELVDLAAELRPDAILIDISMPLLNGIEATRQICKAAPKARIVVLTQQTGKEYVQAALQAGARGYVVKQSAPTELLTALREVLAGRFYVTRLVVPKEIAGLLNGGGNPLEWFAGQLTPRQREVLQLVGEGKSGKEIADILQISVKTVEFHKAKLMDQLGLHTTAELTRYAIEHGII